MQITKSIRQPVFNSQIRDMLKVLNVMSDQSEVVYQRRACNKQVDLWRWSSTVEQAGANLTKLSCHLMVDGEYLQIGEKFDQSSKAVGSRVFSIDPGIEFACNDG